MYSDLTYMTGHQSTNVPSKQDNRLVMKMAFQLKFEKLQ